MESVIGYKVFDSEWKCRGFQFEVGKRFKQEGTPILCEHAFHFCRIAANCFNYYSFDPQNKVALIKAHGTVVGDPEDKEGCNDIEILEEISWESLLKLVNTGIGNSGIGNSGDSNSGNCNSGDSNSGYRNSGNRNSGNWNSGYSNSGYSNSGDSNSGDRNSGDSNSGNWNSGDWNSGYMNSKTPDTILVFNKPVRRDTWDACDKPNFIYFDSTEWVCWNSMSDDEKKEYPKSFVTNGYLKTYGYKEAWSKAYSEASKEDIERLKNLPNFDANVFFEISGIRVE